MKINALFFRKLLALILIPALLTPAYAAIPGNALCTPKGYTLGFFNGVWNTKFEADNGRDALRNLLTESYNSENVRYETFYNYSGKNPGSGATLMQDVAEVFIQRAREIDSSGEMGNRFEYFWDNLSGDKSLTNKIRDLLPSAALILDQIGATIINKLVGAISALVSNPPTEATYSLHKTRIDALSVEGQKLIFVAHSQGNLFVNRAYDYALTKISASSIGVAHIAPASTTLRGGHLLADIDLVINGLRLTGITSVPPINLNLPLSGADASGHMLVETYLDASRPARDQVKSLVERAMQQLQAPPTQGNVGAFTVTLTWDGQGDVDLHSFEPSGTQVYYGSRNGNIGHLDVDNVIANGPEHYFASCDASVLQAGTYSFGINNFSGATGRTATVQVSTSSGGVLSSKSLDVGAVRGSSGNNAPIPVVKLVVSKDAATGAFDFLAQ